MNWELIAWFFGIVATLYGLKFVLVLFKTLFNKDSMKNAINAVGESAQRSANNLTKKMTKKMKQAKQRKREQKELNKPVVVVR